MRLPSPAALPPRAGGASTTTASPFRPSSRVPRHPTARGRPREGSCVSTSSSTARSFAPSFAPTSRSRVETCCSSCALRGCASMSACAWRRSSDGVRTDDGRQAAVWGWSYRTLEGHLEAGEMAYEVRKWLDTGEVEFRIHAFSRTAQISNPVVRLGFRLFGRREQTRFARSACERMRRLTEAELAAAGHRAEPAGGGGLVVRPTRRSR